MANVTIKTSDPRFAIAISEGIATQELQMVKAECKRLNAINGVRAYGDSVRWQSVAGALAVKYSTRPHGRLYDAVLGLWALMWLNILEWHAYLQAWNREA